MQWERYSPSPEFGNRSYEPDLHVCRCRGEWGDGHVRQGSRGKGGVPPAAKSRLAQAHQRYSQVEPGGNHAVLNFPKSSQISIRQPQSLIYRSYFVSYF